MYVLKTSSFHLGLCTDTLNPLFILAYVQTCNRSHDYLATNEDMLEKVFSLGKMLRNFNIQHRVLAKCLQKYDLYKTVEISPFNLTT